MNPGTVAVIIVNYNAGKHLGQCLAALAGQTRMPNRVLLIDNASTDGSLDGIETRLPQFEIIRLEKNTGFAAANNLGIEKVPDCEWVALLNPDAFADPGWLEQLLQAAQAYPEFSVFGSKLLCAGNRERLDGAGDVYHVSGLVWRRFHGQPVTRGEKAEEIFSPCAAAALYKRRAVVEAGGFDTDYFCYVEDVDLGFRLQLLGHRARYVPDSIVEHVGWGTTEQRGDFSLYHGHRNLVWTWVKNMPRPLCCRYLLQFLVWNVLTVLVFACRGKGAVLLRAKWDALMRLPGMLKKRRRMQQTIEIDPERLAGLMNREWSAPYTNFKNRANNRSGN